MNPWLRSPHGDEAQIAGSPRKRLPFGQEVRNFWLRAVASKPAVRDFVLPVVVGLLWLGGAWLLNAPPSISSGIAGTVIVGGLAYLLVARSRYWGFREVLRTLRRISDAAREPGRSFFIDLTAARMQETCRVVEGLAHGTYRAETTELLQEWFGTFFEQGGHTYSALDSHLPSRYLQDYGWYLALHESAIEGNRVRPGGMRVLVADRNALTNDYLADSNAYRRFYEWHDRNQVLARWVEPAKLIALKKQHQLDANVDIGIWDQYAVLFSRGADESVTITMVFKGDSTAEPSYEKISAYMDAVSDLSQPLNSSPPGLEMGDDALVDRWAEYVDPASRAAEASLWRRFLCKALGESRIVLDAAAGIGCDSVMLAELGFSVVSNEVDARLYRAAVQYAAEHGIALELKRALWEELPGAIGGGFRFDAVVVAGNSLCLVDDRRRQRRAVEAFHQVLVEGGTLIIDERNFGFMLQMRHEILENPLEAFPPLINGDPMYPGSGLKGYPSVISDGRVEWSFFHNNPPVASVDEIHTRSTEFATLALYPFKHGELFNLLSSVGFCRIEVFADLERVDSGDGRMPSQEALGDASFITYVARRATRT